MRRLAASIGCAWTLACAAPPSDAPGGAAIVECDEGADAHVVDVGLPTFAPATIELDGPGVVRFRVVDGLAHAIATGLVLGAAALPDGRVDVTLLGHEEACAAFTEGGEHPLFDALYPLDLTAVVVVR